MEKTGQFYEFFLKKRFFNFLSHFHWCLFLSYIGFWTFLSFFYRSFLFLLLFSFNIKCAKPNVFLSIFHLIITFVEDPLCMHSGVNSCLPPWLKQIPFGIKTYLPRC